MGQGLRASWVVGWVCWVCWVVEAWLLSKGVKGLYNLNVWTMLIVRPLVGGDIVLHRFKLPR
jgi:hypothetical protein